MLRVAERWEVLVGCLPLLHKWITVEVIGHSHTQRCSVCGKTRVRVINSPSRASRPDTGGPRR